MTKEELFSVIDHTQLQPYAVWADIDTLCAQAVQYGMASVCIPSSYVRQAREAYPKLTICTVIGFPHGNMNTAAKLAEIRQALIDGADEFDMVIQIGWAKDGLYDQIEDEIRQLKAAAGSHILKVIIETCFLTQEEKIEVCRAVTRAGADFIKTSTGFGTAGAALADVRLMQEHIGAHVQIKAAGGIRTLADAVGYLEAGCSRIGASRGLQMAEELSEG